MLRYGSARLHVFAGRLDDVAHRAWISRWRQAVPVALPVPDEAFSITQEGLDHELTLTTVSTPRWTPAFLWVSSRREWHFRMDSELQRLLEDKRALVELVRTIRFAGT